MNTYVTGSTIRQLRETKHLTQAELAAKLSVSAKTISKWETAKGLPDISLLEPLAAALGVSVLELVHKFEEVNDLKLCYKIAPRRAGDIIAIWADPTLANTELGWTAERTLDETLRAAWKWEKHIRGIE